MVLLLLLLVASLVLLVGPLALSPALACSASPARRIPCPHLPLDRPSFAPDASPWGRGLVLGIIIGRWPCPLGKLEHGFGFPLRFAS